MTQTQTSPVGHYAPDFELPSVDGDVYHLTRCRQAYQALGIVFLSDDCPVVQAYVGRLKQLQADFAPQGFTLIGINANDAAQSPEDSFDGMKGFALEYQLTFPYLRDPSQDVARSFRAERTPQAFLLDQEGIVRYCGALDDNPTAEAVRVAYLREAIAQLLAGTPITTPFTAAVGSPLKWRS